MKQEKQFMRQKEFLVNVTGSNLCFMNINDPSYAATLVTAIVHLAISCPATAVAEFYLTQI